MARQQAAEEHDFRQRYPDFPDGGSELPGDLAVAGEGTEVVEQDDMATAFTPGQDFMVGHAIDAAVQRDMSRPRMAQAELQLAEKWIVLL